MNISEIKKQLCSTFPVALGGILALSWCHEQELLVTSPRNTEQRLLHQPGMEAGPQGSPELYSHALQKHHFPHSLSVQ